MLTHSTASEKNFRVGAPRFVILEGACIRSSLLVPRAARGAAATERAGDVLVKESARACNYFSDDDRDDDDAVTF